MRDRGASFMRRTQRGFTLLELLVVIVIIAVLGGMTALAVRDRDAQGLVDREAERLVLLLGGLREDALFSYRPVAVFFHQDGYRFLLGEAAGWIDFPDTLFRPREFPADMEAVLYVEGRPVVLETEGSGDADPQVVFFPDTGAIPFELVLRLADAAPRTLAGSPSGRVHIKERQGA
ncbi:MAG: GspH/FimT family pseudopilin [Pseudomonadota bacterium]